MKLFNTILPQEKQTPLDEIRPYIVQIARFDPSKGIPDVMDSCRKLRLMLEEQFQRIRFITPTPQSRNTAPIQV